MNLSKIKDAIEGLITVGNLNDYSNLKLKISPESEEQFQPVIEEIEKDPEGSQYKYIVSPSQLVFAYKSIPIKNLFINLFKLV